MSESIVCLIASATDRGRVRRYLNAELDAWVKARKRAKSGQAYRLAEERIDAILAMYRPLLGDLQGPKVPPV